MTEMHRGFLEDCETEKLQYSGAIQGYGALLITSADLQLSHYSQNFTERLGVDPAQLLEWIKQGKLIPSLVNLEAQPGARLQMEAAFESSEGSFDLQVARGLQHEFIIELYATQVACPDWENPPDMSKAQNLADITRLREQLVAWISRVSGFDRVMYYQFLEQGDGEVVVEVCRETAQGSYLGLRYPASDIPQIARQIYLKNPWRVIFDAKAASVPVVGETQADLTWSDLRSVSPVHAVYMQNMGDRASLSLPVSAGVELDALISCHSHQPHRLPLKRLIAIHDAVRHFNRVMRNRMTTDRVRLVDEIAYNTQKLLRSLKAMEVGQTQWQALSDWLMQEFEADAVVWYRHDQIFRAGIEVEDALIDSLDNWFTHKCDELVFFEERIRTRLSIDLLTHLAGAAGLRVRLAKDVAATRLYLFRSEQVEEVLWGGNPDKPVDFHDGVLGIAPRRSFGKWVEKRLGYSRAWGNAARLRLLRLRDELQRYDGQLPGVNASPDKLEQYEI